MAPFITMVTLYTTYKRDNEEEWRGPAKVVFQDGKVIFIRHGGYAVRVSANRLVKAGDELEKRIREENEEFTVHEQVHKKEEDIKVEKDIKKNKKNVKSPVAVVITEAESETDQ